MAPASYPPSNADSAKIEAFASILVAARKSGEALGPVPAELIPSDATEAQLIDDRVAELSGWPVLGWKIGCTSEHAQKLLGAKGPFAGRVYSILASGESLDTAALGANPHLEGEFAFTLACDIAADRESRSRSELLAVIASVHPAIELVGGRFADFLGTPLNCLIADAGANSLLILGPAAADPDLEMLSHRSATMTVDGTVTGQGTGAHVMGDPIAALGWLLDHLGARGIALSEGQVVTTGTATQVSALPPGATAINTIDTIGSVSLTRS